MKVLPSNFSNTFVCMTQLFLGWFSYFFNFKICCFYVCQQKPGASNFIIAHTPSSVTFLPKAGAIPSDEVSSVIGLALGFSSTKVRKIIFEFSVKAFPA